MHILAIAVVAFCGLLIGFALFLLIWAVRKMIKGRCCEGCSGCSQAANCSSRNAEQTTKTKK